MRSRRRPRGSLTGKSLLAYCDRVADVYKAIADETRRLLLDELRERDDQTLFELCGRLAMRHGATVTRQAVSQHLAVLEEAGLVHSERRGRSRFHTLDTTPLAEIAERWPQRKADTP